MIRKASLLLLLFAVPLHAESPLMGRTIAIDAGHGTIDYQGRIINSGKITRDGKFSEYDLTFKIAQRLGKKIEEEGGRVIYTRTPVDYWRQASSVTEDNKARALLANELKAEVFIAVHCDWDPRSKMKGITTYYKTSASERLGVAIHKKLIAKTEAFNRHVKRDSFTVLDQAKMPSVLIETGFLSNRPEAKKLASSTYQIKIAEAIVAGLSTYFAN